MWWSPIGVRQGSTGMAWSAECRRCCTGGWGILVECSTMADDGDGCSAVCWACGFGGGGDGCEGNDGEVDRSDGRGTWVGSDHNLSELPRY